MKFCCMSDLHGHLPEQLPECDAVLLAGDICVGGNVAKQFEWLDDTFRRWLRRLERPVFACAGNHDWPMAQSLDQVRGLRLPWTYLQDDWVRFNGLKIYGTPWQKRFYDWAFNLEESQLAGKWNLIPDDTNILICHSPPKFYGDQNPSGEFCGSESLTWRIGQLPSLQIVVFGHIHSGRGVYQSKNTVLVNAAFVNERYRPIYQPIVVDAKENANA